MDSSRPAAASLSEASRRMTSTLGSVGRTKAASSSGADGLGARGRAGDRPLSRGGGVGELVPAALRAVRKGGRVVCAGIHMSDIPSFPYNLLWQERQLLSVANLTRQ